jgi:hypothetical protein
MVAFSELPLAAVWHITQLARGRLVPGTNPYACISRQWRDACGSTGAAGDAESLQLFIEQGYMSAKQLARLAAWLSMYGQHVEVLIMGATMIHAQQLALFWQPAATLSRLKRLEVVQKHSLVMLAPVLGQLPQLQHLTAHVSMASMGLEQMDVSLEGEVEGVFINEAGAAWDVPDLQQLCPQLIDLNLTVVPDSSWPVWVDARLPWLLPAPLQQLTLAAWQHTSRVSAASLVHLTALQQLTLAKIDVPEPGAGELAVELVALQQLRIVDPAFKLNPNRPEEDSMLQLAPLMTAYHCSRDTPCCYVRLVPNLVHLTSLMLFSETCPHTGLDEILAALPHLQELGMRGYIGHSVEAALRMAGSMEQLRSLHLEGFSLTPTALHTSLGYVTQLTSLVLLVKVSAQASSECVFVEPPSHQLQQLQRLVVHKHLLVCYKGDWLAHLSSLTTLEVILPSHMRELFGWSMPNWCACNGNQWEDDPMLMRKMLLKVPQWPASLQGVVLWVHWMPGLGDCKTRSWSFTAPGASSSGRRVTVWYEQRRGTAEGWARPFQRCTHLPGVWELQGQVAGSNWQAQYW